MKQYYLLKLISENDRIISNKLYKTEFTSPFCIFEILTKEAIDNYTEIYFVLTDYVDYLFKFLHIENTNEYDKACKSFYNKVNFACGGIFYDYLYSNTLEFTIHLTSKNFNKYYSFNQELFFDELKKELVNYNEIVCEINYFYNGKEYFSVGIEPLYISLRTKNNEEYIYEITNNMTFLHRNHDFSIKEFKKFDTFRDLVLNCIELDKKEFMSKHYKYLSKNEKLIINEYYDILIDIGKGIEL